MQAREIEAEIADYLRRAGVNINVGHEPYIHVGYNRDALYLRPLAEHLADYINQRGTKS